MNKKVFGEFREVVECYVRGSCDLDLEEELVVMPQQQEEEDGFQ